MTSRLRTNLLLATFSVILTAAVGIGIFEYVKGQEYDRWRVQFAQTDTLADLMTVASDDPKLVWEYKPYGEYADYGIRVNRWGFRDRDFETKEKPAGLYRVAFIGDSVTLGLWTGEPYIFVRQFESIANDLAPAKPIQALNFSVDGYDAHQVAELLRARVLDFQPDKVVYAMHLNDFDFEGAAGDKLAYFKRPKSFLWPYVTYDFDVLFRHRNTTEYHLFNFEKNKEEVYAEIVAMRDLLKQKGIGFEVAVLPVFKDWPQYPLSAVHEEIGRFLRGAGIAHVDLSGEFLKEGKEIAYFSHDVWHPNHRGHRLIAERLIEPVLGTEMPLRPMPYATDAPTVVPDSYFDLSPLSEIAVTTVQRARKEGGLFEERARLDGGRGLLIDEYGLGAAFSPQVASRLADSENFDTRLRGLLAQAKNPATIGKTETFESADRIGRYARYQVVGPDSAPSNCFFSLAAYRFGALAAVAQSFDSYVMVNYCAAVVPEAILLGLLKALKPRAPVTAAAKP